MLKDMGEAADLLFRRATKEQNALGFAVGVTVLGNTPGFTGFKGKIERIEQERRGSETVDIVLVRFDDNTAWKGNRMDAGELFLPLRPAKIRVVGSGGISLIAPVENGVPIVTVVDIAKRSPLYVALLALNNGLHLKKDENLEFTSAVVMQEEEIERRSTPREVKELL